MKKGKLRIIEDGMVAFYCPGCEEHHYVHIKSDGFGDNRPIWVFNGNYDKPTFTPSILVKSGHYCDHTKADDCWCNFKEKHPGEGEPPFKCGICHTFVTDGKIHYLADSTHKLSGQTIDMLEEGEVKQ